MKATIAINRLFKRLRRRFPTHDLQYALVWEKTKKGWPHAHILLRAPYIPQPLVSALWQALTGAYIVDVRKVHNRQHAASYVTKYLTKNPEVPAGFRRFRTSRLYSAPAPRHVLRDYLSLDGFLRFPHPVSVLMTEFSELGSNWSTLWPDLYTANAPPSLVASFERG